MPSEFASRINGPFRGILRWEDLDALWARVRAEPQGWYASLAGQAPPEATLEADALAHFVTEIDTLLRREHEHDYCGIVYADDPQRPDLIKIYDPHHLGSSCGSSGQRIPPRWILSRLRPARIEDDAPLPGVRRRWWERIFHRAET
ncbi:MAG: hypothetical protein ACFCUG_11000 [Thiotrichales bacterium]